MFEFFFDTARAIINLFLQGTIKAYPDITYIISHCGGALPPLIDRFSAFAGVLPDAKIDPAVTPAFVRERLLNQFWFDMAGLSWPNQIKMLLPYTSTDHLLYGSDWPYTPLPAVKRMAEVMDESMPAVFSQENVLEAIYIDNAKALLARNIQ